MRVKRQSTTFVVTVVIALSSHARAGAPVDTAITYQGQFKEAGIPLSGNVDLRFELFDAEVGGNSVRSPLLIQDVAVIKGLFSAELDFGPGAFTGEARWVQIEVRNPHDPTDTEAFTPLAPRQALTAAPYALYSLAPWASHGTDISFKSGSVGIGTDVPEGLLDLRHDSVGEFILVGSGEGNISRVKIGQDENHYFGLEYNGSFDRLDFIPEDGVGFGVPLLSLNAASNDVLLTPFGSGNVGIGTSTPDVPLHVNAGTDAAPDQGGYIQAGRTNGLNVVIDDNEMMARNNGVASNLHINNNGGDVIFGGGIQVNGESSLDLGYEIVTKTSDQNSFSTATCPQGKRVIGGGCKSTGIFDPVIFSYPAGNGTAWACNIDDGAFGSEDVTAYAICINIS